MKVLIERLEAYFEIGIFPEEMILNDPIENWPMVDVLMGWHSDGTFFGFVLHKVFHSIRQLNM